MQDYGSGGSPNEYLVDGKTAYEAAYTDRIDEKVVSQLVGEAIAGVAGVLGLKGGLTDIFKKDDDLTRGVTVEALDDNKAKVSVRLIADDDHNAGEVITGVAAAITGALQRQAGLQPATVEIELAEGPPRKEFF